MTPSPVAEVELWICQCQLGSHSSSDLLSCSISLVHSPVTEVPTLSVSTDSLVLRPPRRNYGAPSSNTHGQVSSEAEREMETSLRKDGNPSVTTITVQSLAALAKVTRYEASVAFVHGDSQYVDEDLATSEMSPNDILDVSPGLTGNIPPGGTIALTLSLKEHMEDMSPYLILLHIRDQSAPSRACDLVVRVKIAPYYRSRVGSVRQLYMDPPGSSRHDHKVTTASFLDVIDNDSGDDFSVTKEDLARAFMVSRITKPLPISADTIVLCHVVEGNSATI